MARDLDPRASHRALRRRTLRVHRLAALCLRGTRQWPVLLQAAPALAIPALAAAQTAAARPPAPPTPERLMAAPQLEPPAADRVASPLRALLPAQALRRE